MKRFQVPAVLLLSFLLTSCTFQRGTLVESNSSPAVVVYTYWYYPDCQVYYDYQRHYYYYPENNVWRQSVVPPARYNLSTTHVLVDVKSDRPYVDYDKHRVKYPAPKPLDDRGHKMDMDRKSPADTGRDDRMEKGAKPPMDRVNPKDKKSKGKKTGVNPKTNNGKKEKPGKEVLGNEKGFKDQDRRDSEDSSMDRGPKDKRDGRDRAKMSKTLGEGIR